MPVLRSSILVFSAAVAACTYAGAECENRSAHPEWIFCDDFESAGALVGPGRYFEYNDNAGDFAAAGGIGWKGSRGMRARWQKAEVDAGNLKVSFGRSPNSAWSKGIMPGKDYREIFYRIFLRTQKGWLGDPFKLSRTTVMAKADWSQAMIAHLWGDRAEHLQLDPVRCVDGSGNVKCSGYNDFTHMEWIGAKAGSTPVYDALNSGRWMCVEVHVRLNDAGMSNGVHEFWLDDKLEARREGLNFLGSYKEYGLNAVFLENYWNSGSPQLQERYFDNLVISTARVGCQEAAAPMGVGIGDPKAQPNGLTGALILPGADAGKGPLGRMDGRLLPGAPVGFQAAARPTGVFLRWPDQVAAPTH